MSRCPTGRGVAGKTPKPKETESSRKGKVQSPKTPDTRVCEKMVTFDTFGSITARTCYCIRRGREVHVPLIQHVSASQSITTLCDWSSGDLMVAGSCDKTEGLVPLALEDRGQVIVGGLIVKL
ncbi:hypothetical protein ACOMHN_011716 [Nucella lapillus]